MCGIAGIYLKRSDLSSTNIPVERLVDELFCRIADRGRHATGYVAVSEDGKVVQMEKDDIPAEFFVQLRENLPPETKTVLCHTRFATQGATTEMENNHPVVYGSTFVTHNGVVYNDDFIFRTEQMPRNAEVDSIVFPALLSVHGWENAEEELQKVQGSYAIAAVNPISAPNELILARGESSPLYYVVTRQAIVWASEYKHLTEAWATAYGTPPKTISMLQEGEMIRVKDDEYDLKRYMARPTYGGYSGYTTSYRQSHWWDRDDPTDEPVKRGEINLDCCECGNRMGVKPVEWEWESETHVTKYKVWLCDGCYTETDGEWERLRFGYVDVSTIENVTTTKPPTQKNIGTITADDVNVDRFLALQCGDVIPEDLLYCFRDSDCESCGTIPVFGLNDDGMPECQECYETTLLLTEGENGEIVLTQCDGCTLMTNELTPTDQGAFCNICLSASHDFDVCGTCNKVRDATVFTYKAGKAVCPDCKTNREDLTNPRLFNADTPESDMVDVVERLYRSHNQGLVGMTDRDPAVRKVARETGFSDGVLTWLLFHSSQITNYLLDDLRAMYGLRVMDEEYTAKAASDLA